MLTQTTELAIRTLFFLALEGHGEPFSPRRIALSLECSRSYLAKTVGLLVKAGVLRSIRGSAGGVVLAKDPQEIRLLDVVEACQGLITAQYCESSDGESEVCSFHTAMLELHEVTVGTLSRWTLLDLLVCPATVDGAEHNCRMFFSGCERHCSKARRLQGRELNRKEKV